MGNTVVGKVLFKKIIIFFLKKKRKTENKLHNCKNMLGCQTSSEKWQLNSVLAEEFGPS